MTPEQLKLSILRQAFVGQLVVGTFDSKKPDVKEIEYSDDYYEIPSSWFWSNLGSCCLIYTGNSISENVKKAKYAGLEEGYDYIATKDVSFNHVISYDNGVRIPKGDNFKIARSGSVLMCIEGGSAGRKIGIVDRDVCFGNKLCSFESSKIDNTFIYYYLQSDYFKDFFSDNITGVIGGVSINKLKSLPIPVPSILEQKAIVSKIEELMPFVDQYGESYEELEHFNIKFPKEMKKSILQYAVQGKLVEQKEEEGTAEDLYQQIYAEKQTLIADGRIKKEKSLEEISENEMPFDIPKSWKWVRLIDLIYNKPRNGYSPKGVDYETKYRNLTLTATTSGFFKADEYKYIDINEEVASKFWIKHNDILIQRSNSRELVGTSCIYNGPDDMFVYPDLMMRIHVFEKNVNVKYVDYVLKSPFIKAYFSRNASGTAKSMPKINQTIVSNAIIPLPPLEEQYRIVAKIEELLPYCEKLTK